MWFKKLFFSFILSILFFSCSEDTENFFPRNLKDYIEVNKNRELATVTAFAANTSGNVGVCSIFYYPEEGATDIRYYETENITVNENDFSNYRRQSFTSSDAFGSAIKHFVRQGTTEAWCLVTYKTNGKLHISNPIKLKNNTAPTEYTSKVSITYPETLQPVFTWTDVIVTNNERYLQVILDAENNLISGTFTNDTYFKFYDETNVIEPKIASNTSKKLVADNVYSFTVLGIDKDNWVSLRIDEDFIPRNLSEYIAVNPQKEQQNMFAFAATANNNKEVTYIYYQPADGVFDFRYYETENTSVDQTDFSNYRRKNISSTAVFDGAFRRFTHNSSKEVWCLITYTSEDKIYISKPIRTKNLFRQTEWLTEVTIEYPETLKPKFTWQDGVYAENDIYLQIISLDDDTVLSATITKEKQFQYYNDTNVLDEIHTVTPPSMAIDQENKFFLFGISKDYWVNLILQKTFIVE